MDQMRALVTDLAGADISITKQQEGPGGALPIAIDVLGDDLDDLAAATDDLVARMESLGGFVDIGRQSPTAWHGMDTCYGSGCGKPAWCVDCRSRYYDQNADARCPYFGLSP